LYREATLHNMPTYTLGLHILEHYSTLLYFTTVSWRWL